MPIVQTSDKTDLYVKDWGNGRPVVLIHGWPLNADSWEHQALALLEAGYRVVSYDRRGFGRSGQPTGGYDYDTMADDLASIMNALDLRDATIVGFSMGGGEVARYIGRHGTQRLRSAALISSVAPFMLKTDDNEGGVPEDVFVGMKDGIRKDRPAFFETFFKDFFGGDVSDATRHWAWGMAMLASPKATLDCVDAFGRTDFREDVKKFDLPTLIVHGTGDEIVPIDTAGRAAAKLVPNATVEEYDGAPHGLTATHGDRLNTDLLAFLKG
ncbi:alpha/beta hydrolase [Palleronia sp. LCG004]|uniref:alpha/beta fold hydrolase n=1 Tax=Palleronia sp. LCG004 TaxID=3079304 RepID=UPI002941F743|nr:alpha/beta hydrolase [Palleronia sp. LCG004]WOI57270.1 alpha/beta hydrolase [Palleronia sp. LCG004]